MAYTALRISIPEPCHEDWNDMSPVAGEQARHCDSCEKNVVDFTGFSDAQLRAYASDPNAKICGRFRPDQLGRPLRATHKPSYTPLKVAATAAGLLLSGAAVDAQSIPPEPTPTDTITKPSLLDHMDQLQIMGEVAPVEIPEPVEAVDTTPEPHRLMGRIATYHIEPAPPVEADTVAQAPVVSPDEFICTKGQPQAPATPVVTPTVDTVPPIDENGYEEIMGFVIMEYPEPTGWDKVVDTVKTFINPAPTTPALHPRQRKTDPGLAVEPRPNAPEYLEEATISPNPARENVIVEVDVPESGKLELQWLDASGRELYRVTRLVFAGKNTLLEDLDFINTQGIVFLRITDAAGARTTKPVVIRP